MAPVSGTCAPLGSCWGCVLASCLDHGNLLRLLREVEHNCWRCADVRGAVTELSTLVQSPAEDDPFGGERARVTAATHRSGNRHNTGNKPENVHWNRGDWILAWKGETLLIGSVA